LQLKILRLKVLSRLQYCIELKNSSLVSNIVAVINVVQVYNSLFDSARCFCITRLKPSQNADCYMVLTTALSILSQITENFGEIHDLI
jgi:hypothetical protein